MDDEAARPSAGPVVGAIALGVAPLPFLAIYAVLFIAHGGIHHVAPPDITGSNGGELIAGLIAAAGFALVTVSAASFLGRSRRWLFVLVQLAVAAGSAYLLADPTAGPSGVPALLLGTGAGSAVLALLPAGHRHVRAGHPAPTHREHVYEPTG